MPDRETQAQIARVIFEAIANGEHVTDVQRLQLADWIRGKDIRALDAIPEGTKTAQTINVATLESVVSQLAEKPSLAEQLTIFVDHWGMDYYDPAVNVVSAVRQIIIIALGDARRLEKQRDGGGAKLRTDSVEDFLAGRYRIER